MSELGAVEHCICGRFEEAQGPARHIEDAINGHGHQEAYAFLRRLEGSRKRGDRDRYADILVRFEQYAEFGELDVPRELNHLVGDLWEIKTASDRLPFFSHSHAGKHEQTVRLTHGFEKSKGRTAQGRIPRKHLDRAAWVMRSDRERGDAS